MLGYLVFCRVFDNGTVVVQDQGGFLPDKDTLRKIQREIDAICKLSDNQIEYENWKRDNKYADEHKRMNEATCNFDKPEKKNPVGDIYLMKDVNRGCYKIGFSTNLKSRIDQLKTANAGIEYQKHYRGSMSDEKHLHSTFEGVRVSGEWFSLTDLHLAEIERYFNLKTA